MAIYYVYSAAAGSANGTSWVNAYTTLTTAFSGHSAGDVYYVAHDHAESTASAITLTSNGTVANPTKVICVDRAGTVPPVSADRRTTAQIANTTGNLTIASYTHYDGIIFNAGAAAATTSLLITQTAGGIWQRFDNCSLRLVTTSASSQILLAGGSAGGAHIELNNTTVSFAATGQRITCYGTLKWRNTPSALLGTIPTTLLTPSAADGGSVECIGVDFSAAGSGKTIVAPTNTQGGSYRFIDCKLDAAVTKASTPVSPGGTEVDFIRCGATGVNYTIYRTRPPAALNEETTIVRTGGATDGTTPISWKVITTANCIYSRPFECPPIAIWNDTTGSAMTATVECIAAAIMTDQEIWLDLEYLGDASSPQGSFVNDGMANLLVTAANQTTSSETWGGSTTAFKLAVTFTAQQKGWVYARVNVGKASSTVYIDPLITLT